MKRKSLFFANTSPGQNLLPPPKLKILQNDKYPQFQNQQEHSLNEVIDFNF